MTLQTYFSRPDAMSRAELAAALGISQGRLSQLRDETNWPPELALKVETVTKGALSASAICPVIAQAREQAA